MNLAGVAVPDTPVAALALEVVQQYSAPALVNHCQAGGHVGWVFAAGAGWPAERRQQVSDAIVHHMVGTEVDVDPEGWALDVATGLDISGRRIQLWPRELLGELVEAYPRLDLATRFTACFRDQAERKPSSAAGESAALLAERLAANPLDRL